jgi:nitrogen regulatory protein PII
MKLIEAYIPVDALQQVRQVLSSQGLEDIIASDTAVERADDDGPGWEIPTAGLVPQIKLEVAVADDRAIPTAHQILDTLGRRRTDPKVHVLIGRLDEVVRIETGERGPAAL